ncbi:MAG: TSUP family transporter [Alphaproteobacteria bacterium]|nr:TSUP family transporter [Alphaproteobacteria bacterium]
MIHALMLAFVAGIVTTLAGFGGGQLLVLGLAALWGPLAALTATGPALLVGNLHRLLLFRADVDQRASGVYAVGAFPGALVGGVTATVVPERVLVVGMIGVAVLAVARHVLDPRHRVPVWLLGPGGAVVGFVAATGGGGGVLAAPLLLGTGMSRAAYVAAMATGALAIHTGRMLGYASRGAMAPSDWALGLGLAVAIAAGNTVGRRLRDRLSERWMARAELGVLVASVLAAVSAAG